MLWTWHFNGQLPQIGKIIVDGTIVPIEKNMKTTTNINTKIKELELNFAAIMVKMFDRENIAAQFIVYLPRKKENFR